MLTTRAVPALVAVLASAGAAAQEPVANTDCDGQGHWSSSRHVCEVREVTVPVAKTLSIDAGMNGGVRVTGTDRKDVLVRATVHAWGGDEDAARAIAAQVVVRTDDTIRAEGPDQHGRDGWAVNYEVLTPREINLDLRSSNGGVAITNVRGDLQFATLNGGIALDGVAGNVSGRATNGPVSVKLTGPQWDGQALDVSTTNGPVRVQIPENYSARLETGTVNGPLHIDVPVVLKGNIGRSVSTTLGKGGALVRAETTNGPVSISKY